MLKYAAATALVIALNITVLTPAFSAATRTWAGYDRQCTLECSQKFGYTVRVPCSPGVPGYVTGMKGLCDQRVVPVETAFACVKTCVKAKDPQRAQALGWGR
jgi:hypothetical protein